MLDVKVSPDIIFKMFMHRDVKKDDINWILDLKDGYSIHFTVTHNIIKRCSCECFKHGQLDVIDARLDLIKKILQTVKSSTILQIPQI